MCLAIPSEVIELLDDERATVDIGGAQHDISIAFVDDVSVGDYVLVHVGYALSRMDADEAKKTLDLIDEMNEAGAKEAKAPL